MFKNKLKWKGTYNQNKQCKYPYMNMRHYFNVNSNSILKYGRYSIGVTVMREAHLC